MSRFTSGAQPQGSAEGAVSVAGAILELGSGWERAGCGSRSDRDLQWDRMFSRQGLLAEGCEGVGTGRERALSVRLCSARAAPRFKPSPWAWTHVRSSNPDTFATCQCCFLCPGKRPEWGILFIPTGPVKSNGLGLSALRNGPRLEVSPAVGGDLDSEPGGGVGKAAGRPAGTPPCSPPPLL